MACNICGVDLGVFARWERITVAYRRKWIFQRPEDKIMSTVISRKIKGIFHVPIIVERNRFQEMFFKL